MYFISQQWNICFLLIRNLRDYISSPRIRFHPTVPRQLTLELSLLLAYRNNWISYLHSQCALVSGKGGSNQIENRCMLAFSDTLQNVLKQGRKVCFFIIGIHCGNVTFHVPSGMYSLRPAETAVTHT